MTTVTIEYFAVLRECAGQASEEFATDATTAGQLFEQLSREYSFPELSSVKVAINEEFSRMDAPLHDGDKIVFIPPVAGG